ncbi:MAG: hypothetical protein R2838_11620 [Caldilineaceae bacterium]
MLETLHHVKDFGFSFDNLQVDFGAAVKRSRGIVDRQVKGITFLMKRTRSTSSKARVRSTGAHTLKVTPSEFLPDAPERTVTAANFISPRAQVRSLPGTQIDGDKIIQYRACGGAGRGAGKDDRGRFGRDRHGVQLRLQLLRQRHHRH